MRIEEVWTLLEKDLAEVERCIAGNLHSGAPLIGEVGLHLLRGGGKRIRPLLLLLASRVCGYHGDRQHLLASVIEYIHTASLLHDDVVDDAVIRRGQDAANRVFGNQASILVGDYLYSKALYLAVREENQEIMNVLSEATTVMSEGEVMQLSQIGNLDLTEEDYLAVITKKTAVLIAAACELGAILAEAPPSVRKSMVAFGNAVGIAFQLSDDALDYSAQEGKLGKKVGKDLLEGKVTLPLIHVLHEGTEDETARIRLIFEAGEKRAEDLDFVFDCVERYDAVAYTQERTRSYIEQARGNLKPFENSLAKDALLSVSDFVYRRDL
ncbi:MAG: polyprenyl synthetase family protein [Deltaproteobacteria bacterium]|nr:polyprenyl synthetase family protein [Deltaproteobacteria bacterium]